MNIHWRYHTYYTNKLRMESFLITVWEEFKLHKKANFTIRQNSRTLKPHPPILN